MASQDLHRKVESLQHELSVTKLKLERAEAKSKYRENETDTLENEVDSLKVTNAKLVDSKEAIDAECRGLKRELGLAQEESDKWRASHEKNSTLVQAMVKYELSKISRERCERLQFDTMVWDFIENCPGRFSDDLAALVFGQRREQEADEGHVASDSAETSSQTDLDGQQPECLYSTDSRQGNTTQKSSSPEIHEAASDSGSQDSLAEVREQVRKTLEFAPNGINAEFQRKFLAMDRANVHIIHTHIMD